MTSKAELKKQLIVLSFILVLVIVVALLLNIENNDGTNINEVKNVNNNEIIDEKTQKQEMLDNLKGLLEEPEENEEEYIQDETQGTTNKVITTENGETIIVRE